ncbi:DNA topoisomerase III [Marinobacter nanhaiticus D15-8W]|uniref:DNA topoisomerase n=1 Tax=Marinobacter nanhaiticus D15-8W TaxID=626887 RepID=N6VZZ2_9GAMM|nr:DNA topoisomerase III [Marinobacter nanhaiticus]ENO13459.1 DNA topoisomerase III [Marinobacter nanhaiticus D15-8W]BES70825.1 DNA topoisomerase III [Marinobacter nanhaiticus D15-8W]
MRLFIAEKPSLGRAIAAALPGPIQKGKGWLRCGEHDVVTWCIGHLLEPSEPGQYDPRWQKWRLHELPIVPEQWAVTPKESVREQLGVVESLIGDTEHIVHAGDPDREGQLLVDEVLRYFRVRRPVERLLIQDLTPSAVSRSLNQLRDNREFRHLSHSALARQRADWLYGINLTRAYTLRYRQQGQQGVYSVGRVQTPVLGLVVERDKTIAEFEPRPFYTLTVDCSPDSGAETFNAHWRPGETFREFMDEEDRILDRSVVEKVVSEIDGQHGTITEARFRERNEAPPLPLSLSALQIEAGRLFGMGAKAVLDTAQNLYEKHQLITYPRSDCRYLPEAHFQQKHDVIAAIRSVTPGLASHADQADLKRHSRAWDDGKVDAHHAIIPTARQRPAGNLRREEQKIYDLIARYYLMQFYPDAIHREGRLDLKVAGYDFRATETGVVDPGWKVVELRKKEQQEKQSRPLPRLDKGESVHCASPLIKDRMTQPPSHFTDATLLSAMTNIARFVADAELRKTLRDTDGLGTEATRAGIIETLFKRDYLFREGRHIKACEKGHDLIGALPAAVGKPDMTAVWESTLERIRQGEGDPRTFLQTVETQITELITPLQSGATDQAHTVAEQTGVHCPQCRAPMREREGKFGRFWACSRYPQCKGTRRIEDDTAHADGADQAPTPCPACFSPLIRRHGKKGWFWGCSNFPSCRQTVSDIDGKPGLGRA